MRHRYLSQERALRGAPSPRAIACTLERLDGKEPLTDHPCLNAALLAFRDGSAAADALVLRRKDGMPLYRLRRGRRGAVRYWPVTRIER